MHGVENRSKMIPLLGLNGVPLHHAIPATEDHLTFSAFRIQGDRVRDVVLLQPSLLAILEQ